MKLAVLGLEVCHLFANTSLRFLLHLELLSGLLYALLRDLDILLVSMLIDLIQLIVSMCKSIQISEITVGFLLCVL